MTKTTLPAAYRGPARITLAAALGALFLAGPMAASAHAEAVAPPLGTAASFSVLAGETVTNTGPTTISRSVGVHPGDAIPGEDQMTVGGSVHKGDAVALQAKSDLTVAYNNAAGQTPPVLLSNPELGGRTLKGNVYKGGALQLTNNLTLDGENNPDKVWVFQADSTLVSASNASITLINRANPCNVYWQVSSSATIGTGSRFVGTIMAEASIAMQTGATIAGRTLARSGEVTLDNNVFTSPNCNPPGEDTAGPTVPGGDTTGGDTTGGDTTGGDTTGGDTTGTDTAGPTVPGGDTTGDTTSGGDTPADSDNPGDTDNPGDSDNPGAENQVTTTPTGSVDTGFVGTENRSTDGLTVAGWLLAAGFGGLAMVAVRRRRVM